MSTLERAREIRSQLSLREKIETISGSDWMFIKPLWKQGLRGIFMEDASLCMRNDRNKVPATFFPASVGLAATFNRELAARHGGALGEECQAAGVDVLLGPGVNHYRVPTCGRNFEYLGEDPYLAAQLAVPYIQALQDKGVAATVKHFACNNTDWHRRGCNAIVDERTLREIYLPVFEAAVKVAKVKAVMTAYNLLNGTYCGENRWLITDLLIKEWGFKGLVMSDWDSIFNAERAIKSGLHIEMPGEKTWWPPVVMGLVEDKLVSEADIDAKVDAILAFALEAVATREAKAGLGRGRGPEHLQAALDIAREAIVLLKNEGDLLPLKKSMKIGVFGPLAENTPYSGGGSARAKAVSPVSILEALRQIAPQASLVTDVAQAASCDAVIACVGFNHEQESEGNDRPYELPAEQEALLRDLAGRKLPLAVVLLTGGSLDMQGWASGARAILHHWYPGERGCLALAEILFGDVNPSGKLPISMEMKFSDCAAAAHYLPQGESVRQEPDFNELIVRRWDMRYAEGVFTGYRHYDQNNIAPRFPFGHGLSYTSFAYADLKLEGRRVSFSVTNTGTREGAEAAQLYVAPPKQKVPRPPKELKGFAKLKLAPGEKKTVSLELDDRAFAYWDVDAKAWVAEKGSYGILVGASSRDIRLQGSLSL